MNDTVETKSEIEEQQEDIEIIVSEEIADLDTSQEIEDLDDEIAERIQTEIDRRFQSAKDKRWAKLEKQYDALREQMEEGKQIEVETSEFEVDILKKGERLLKKANLSDHPELLEKMGSGEYSKDVSGYVHFLEYVSEMILKATEETPETVVGVIQPSGGIVPTQDLKSLYESARKKLSPGDLNGLTTLKRDFRGRGLEIF